MKLLAGIIVTAILVALLVLYLTRRPPQSVVMPKPVPGQPQAPKAARRVPRAPFVIEGDIRERRLLQYVLPRYPDRAEQLGLSGIYKVRVTVSPAGEVKSFTQMLQTSGESDMDAAALEAVQTWRFSEVPSITGDQNGTIAFHFQIAEAKETARSATPRETATPSAPLKTVPAAQLIDERRRVMRYEDMGPNTIDVSRYPDFHKVNYQLFLQRCSRCHSPARAINSSATSEQDWNYYVELMHTWSLQMLLKPNERRWIVDFLTYDAKIRKLDRREKFAKEQEKLKDQFTAWAAGGERP